jgi:hypothetical protein
LLHAPDRWIFGHLFRSASLPPLDGTPPLQGILTMNILSKRGFPGKISLDLAAQRDETDETIDGAGAKNI